MKTIYFVTGNKNKLKEAKLILKDYDVKNIELDLPEWQGSSDHIAKEKARLAAKKTGKTVFIEDTSLCFNALKGLPGPYIKYFLSKLTLKEMCKLLEGFEDKTAYSLSTVGYCELGKEPVVLSGKVDGKIVMPRGNRFAWDPIFVPDGYSKTFAEMSHEQKNKISHRRKSLEKLRDYLKENSFNYL